MKQGDQVARCIWPGALLSIMLVLSAPPKSSGDSYVYANLQRSRDALLQQRSELERSRADVAAQIDRLQQRLGRLDQYLLQVDGSIRDVEDALRRTR